MTPKRLRTPHTGPEYPFPAGTRVEDNEGDRGTVIGYKDGRVLVNGDGGSRMPWSYRPDELQEVV